MVSASALGAEGYVFKSHYSGILDKWLSGLKH